VFHANIGYLGYIELLFLLTGLMLLLFEAKSYKSAKMNKEEKVARIIGWFNCSIAICTYVGYWVYNQFF
jgi:hypothetical protein